MCGRDMTQPGTGPLYGSNMYEANSLVVPGYVAAGSRCALGRGQKYEYPSFCNFFLVGCSRTRKMVVGRP